MQTSNSVNPVTRKYAEIREAGRASYQAGTVKAFAGFPESLKKRVNLSLRFDRESETQIWAMSLGLVSEHCSFGFLVAGRDFPVHSTLLEGEASEVVTGFSGELDRFPGALASVLSGREVVFNQLIADAGGSVILAATEIPEYVLATRDLIGKLYESEGLAVLPLDNILHSSQVRITRFPDDLTWLPVFHREVEETNERLGEKPIRARIKSVGLAQAYALLTSRP